MASRRVSNWLLVACALLSASGCGSEESVVVGPGPGSEMFKLGDKSGMTAIQYKNCTLVIEDLPSKGVSLGSQGSINDPSPPGGAGGSESRFGNLKISQKYDSQANDVTINGHTFKITDGGKKLTFPDATYDLTGPSMTILIGADGKTRKQGGE